LQKTEIILLVFLLNTGCSVFINAKRHKTSEILYKKEDKFEGGINQWNLSKRNFYINKAEILVEGLEKENKFFGSIKFINPDKYLLGLKTLTGIELTRILLTNDTLLINDRFNKKYYFGSSKYLKQLLGITSDFLPLIFGDIIGENMSDSILYKCNGGEINIEGYKKGTKIDYSFNCKKRKSNYAFIRNSLNQKEVQIIYRHFLEGKGFYIPREIDITDFNKKITIRIKIRKVESPWEGNIELMPGNGYEKLPLK